MPKLSAVRVGPQDKLGTREVVVSHYRENITWLSRLPRNVSFRVYTHVDSSNSSRAGGAGDGGGDGDGDGGGGGGGGGGEDRTTTLSNRGREASAYLAYITDNYDSLPTVIAFVMGNRHAYHNANLSPSHVPAWRNNGDLLWLLSHLRWGGAAIRRGYLPLNFRANLLA